MHQRGAGCEKEMIEEQLKTTFARLIKDARDDLYACAYEREVACIELINGRRAQVTLKIETDEDDWM